MNKNPNGPLVSVVTPSFNTAEYIESTLKSVENQDYPNIEHIVYDGASDDETLEILRRYPKVDWVSEPDNGQSAALNKGFKKASGQYIGWLNSDDVYTEGAISRAVEYLECHTDVAMIYTDLNIIGEDDGVYGHTKGMEFSLKNLLVNNPVKQPTLLMRREVIDLLKGVDEDLHFVMDRELWLRMTIEGLKIKYIPNWVNASFRLVEGTKTFEYTPRFREEWFKVMRASFRNNSFFKGVEQSLMKRALRINRSAFHLSMMNKEFSKGEKIKGMRQAFRAMIANPSTLRNGGLYKQILLGFLGREIDRTQKFQGS